MRQSYKFCTSLVKIKWKIKKLYGKYELSIFFIWTPGEGSILHPGGWFTYDMMIRQPYKLCTSLVKIKWKIKKLYGKYELLTDGRTDGQTDRRTDGQTDDGRKVIPKAHLLFHSRWAKNNMNDPWKCVSIKHFYEILSKQERICSVSAWRIHKKNPNKLRYCF